MTNTARTPSISKQTKLLSFDLETNGLHGKAFAVGAVIMDADGKVHDEFTARARLTEKVDDWVKDNVLPSIADMPITYDNYKDLREAFWAWFVPAQEKADYVLVNNGYPVEYRFLLDSQEANLDERYWQHPFPILELSSLMIMTEHGAGASRRALRKVLDEDFHHKIHHPLEDARMALRLAFEAFRLAGYLDR